MQPFFDDLTNTSAPGSEHGHLNLRDLEYVILTMPVAQALMPKLNFPITRRCIFVCQSQLFSDRFVGPPFFVLGGCG
jgi:hypothetical protein